MRNYILVILLIPVIAYAQDITEDPQGYMVAYMEAIQLAEEHAFLEKFAGNWNYVSTMYMSGMEPFISEGQSSISMIMDGKYLYMVNNGMSGGEPFEGRSFTAFDRTEDAFISTWIDNVGLGILVFRGQQDAEDAMVLTASYTDPVTREYQTHRLVQRLEGPDRFVMEYYIWSTDEQPVKAMETVCERITDGR